MLTFVGLVVFFALLLTALDCLKASLLRIHRQLRTIITLLNEIKEAQQPVGASNVNFYVLENGQKQEIKDMFKKVTDPVKFLVEITDKFGNPAKVDGAPAWALVDPDMGSLLPAEDGLSADFQSAGKIGELKVQLQADADLGEGVKEIFAESEAVDMIAGDAEILKISVE